MFISTASSLFVPFQSFWGLKWPGGSPMSLKVLCSVWYQLFCLPIKGSPYNELPPLPYVGGSHSSDSFLVLLSTGNRHPPSFQAPSSHFLMSRCPLFFSLPCCLNFSRPSFLFCSFRFFFSRFSFITFSCSTCLAAFFLFSSCPVGMFYFLRNPFIKGVH